MTVYIGNLEKLPESLLKLQAAVITADKGWFEGPNYEELSELLGIFICEVESFLDEIGVKEETEYGSNKQDPTVDRRDLGRT